MRWFRFAILTFIALTVQTSLLPVLCPDGLRPWALAVLASIYLLTRPDEWTILQVWIIGFLGDVTSLSPLGSQALAFGLYGLLMTSVRPMLFTESGLAQGAAAGIGVVIISGIYAFLAFLTRSGLPLPYSTVEVLGQALVTGIATGLIVRFCIPRRKLSSRNW